MVFLKPAGFLGYGDDAMLIAPLVLPTDKPWSTVFDANFYRAYRPQEFAGWTDAQLFEYFATVGIRRGDCASPAWCVQTYVMNYPDLMKAFHDPNWWNGDWYQALKHWFDTGIGQGRTGSSIGMCPDGMYPDGHGGCSVVAPSEALIAQPTGTAILTEPPEVIAARQAAAARAAADAAARAAATASQAASLPTVIDPGMVGASFPTPVVQSAPIQTIVDPGTGAVIAGSASIGDSWKRNVKLGLVAAAAYFFLKR